MKYLSLICSFIFLSLAANCQLSTFFVAAHVTDTAYSVTDDSNFVAINPSITSNNKLLVFLGGTGSTTNAYETFPMIAAGVGYHVVSIGYPDTPSVGSVCSPSKDSLCYDNFRQEVCYGTPVSSYVSIDTLHSIYTRIVKLLQYLTTKYPQNNWGQFLTAKGVPVWSNIVMAGHSQGSGHALYFGKTQKCNRVIMFSGVDDYSAYYNKPGHWVYAMPNLSGVGNLYSFLHLQDELVPYYEEFADVAALGMLANGDDSTLVDNKPAPYNNSHCLYTDATPSHTGSGEYHNSTVVDYYTPLNSYGQLLFEPVWGYLLTSTVIPAVPVISTAPSVVTNLCPGTPVTLTSSALSGNLWSTGDTTRSITKEASGSYSVRASLNGYYETSYPTVVIYQACGKPASTAASAITSTTATIKWASVSCAAEYTLLYRKNGATAYTTVKVKDTSYQITGLVASTTYQWEVNTVCVISPVTQSAYTTLATFTTAAAGKTLNDMQDKESSFNIVPNPARSVITVSFDANETNTMLQVVNVTGQAILQKQIASINGKNTVQLDVSTLTAGVYTLLVKTTHGIKAKQFVKE